MFDVNPLLFPLSVRVDIIHWVFHPVGQSYLLVHIFHLLSMS